MFARDDPPPRQRRAVSYAWPNLILLPVLMGALHAVTYTLLIHLLLGEHFGLSAGHPPPWPGAIMLIWLASFWTTRAVGRVPVDDRTGQIISMVCWLVTLVVWFVAEPVYRDARIWADPGSLVDDNAYLVPPLLISMVTWWQGIRYAVDQSSMTAEDTRGTVQRAWLVLGGSLLLAVFIGGETGDEAVRTARIAVPLLLIVSLAVVAGAELETTRRIAVRRGAQPPGWERWFRLVSGLGAFVIVLTVVILALLGPEVLSAIVAAMFTAIRAIGLVVGYIVYAIIFALYQLFMGIVWILEGLFGQSFGRFGPPAVPPMVPMPIDDALFPEQEPTEQWEYAILLRWVVLGLVLLALVIVLFRIARRSGPPSDQGIVEAERDSVFSADLARRQLRDLLRRQRGEERRQPLDLNGTPANVREVMRYLETLAMRQGVGRRTAETSSDFLERLRAVWSGVSPSLLDLNGRYQRIRYGEHPDTKDGPDYPPSLRDWTEVWRRRKEAQPPGQQHE